MWSTLARTLVSSSIKLLSVWIGTIDLLKLPTKDLKTESRPFEALFLLELDCLIIDYTWMLYRIA